MIALGMFGFFLLAFFVFMWRWGKRDSVESAPLLDLVVFTAICVGQILLSVPLLGPFAPFLIVGDAVMLSLLWVPSIGGTVLSSFTGLFDGGNQQVEARPALSSVHAKRMQGRYDDALADVRGQLERFPEDFEAQMVLAELLVESKKDFEAGVEVLETILAQKHPPTQIASALNALADWQIKHRSDPEAARAALQRIVDAFPEDAIASKAAQRITHLPSREDLAARAAPKTFVLEHVEDYMQPGGKRAAIGIAKEQTAEERAEILSERLRKLPKDTEAREQLALLYADEFGQLDWAADQIEQIIRQPHQPDREVIRWLELLASIQRRHKDLPATARTYQRIITQFPTHPGAARARGQLAAMGVTG